MNATERRALVRARDRTANLEGTIAAMFGEMERGVLVDSELTLHKWIEERSEFWHNRLHEERELIITELTRAVEVGGKLKGHRLSDEAQWEPIDYIPSVAAEEISGKISRASAERNLGRFAVVLINRLGGEATVDGTELLAADRFDVEHKVNGSSCTWWVKPEKSSAAQTGEYQEER